MRTYRLKLHHAGLLLLVAAQLFLAASAFGSLKDILGPAPVLNVDWCSQYYWSHAARAFYKTSGRIWGYDPYYMAGYPLDFVFNSSLPVQITSLALQFMSEGAAIKMFYFLTFALVPVFLYLSMKNFDLSSHASLAAAALGTVYFWLAEDALFGQWGMLSGSFILNFFLFPVSLFYCWLNKGDKTAAACMFVAVPLAFLIHKTAFVLLPLPFLFIAVSLRKNIRVSSIIIFLALAAWTLLVNSFWLFPFFHFLHLKIEDPLTTFFQNTDPLRFLKDLVPVQAYFAIPLCRLFMVFMAVTGAVRMHRMRVQSRVLWSLALPVFAFFLLAYFGSFVGPLRHAQPYRYVTAFYFMLLPLAGFGLQGAYAWKGKPAAYAFAAFLAMLMLFPSFRYFPRVSPLSASFPGKVTELLRWIETETDSSARIMIEDINVWDGSTLPYGATRFPGMLPALVERECIGGPLPNAFIRHHHASFHDGRFISRDIATAPDNWIKNMIRLYNIKWAVCWSEAAKTRLEKMNDFAIPKARFENIEVFEFKAESSFFLKGSGNLEAGYDRLVLTGLRSEAGEVVIKYHYDEWFSGEPDTEIFRAEVPEDPIGFIGLRNPGAEVTLNYRR